MYNTLAEKAAKTTLLLREYVPCIFEVVISEKPSCWNPELLVKVKADDRPALDQRTIDRVRQHAPRPKNVMLNSWPENDEISVLSPRNSLKNETDSDAERGLPEIPFSSFRCGLRGLLYPAHMKPLR